MANLDLQINRLFDEFYPQLIKLKNNLTSQLTTGQPPERTNYLNQIIESNGLSCQQIERVGLAVDIIGSTNNSNIAVLCVEKSEFFNSFEFDEHFTLKFLNNAYDFGFLLKVVIGIGVAKILNELQKELNGTIRLLFRTNEVNKFKESDFSTQGDLLNQVSALYEMTFNNTIPSGWVGIKFGPLMASNDIFTLKIYCDKHHGTPNQKFSRIIPIAARVISALQKVTARKIDPLSPVVMSMNAIQSEGDDLQKPECVIIKGRYESIEESVRNQVPDIMVASLRRLLNARGGSCNFGFR